MPNQWHDTSPIYKQLEAQVIAWILNGDYQEGEALPSVRKLSVELQINHLTVSKAFQALAEQNIIEKRRGLGMFVQQGAVSVLHEAEKQKFFDTELPQILRRAKALNIDIADIVQQFEKLGEPS